MFSDFSTEACFTSNEAWDSVDGELVAVELLGVTETGNKVEDVAVGLLVEQSWLLFLIEKDLHWSDRSVAFHQSGIFLRIGGIRVGFLIRN